MFQAASTETRPAVLPAASIAVVGFSGTVRLPRLGAVFVGSDKFDLTAAIAMFDLRRLMLG